MSNSVGFDASRLNTQPGDGVAKIGEAASILSGNQARADIVSDMAKNGGRTKIEQKKFKKKKQEKKAAKKLLARTKFSLKTSLMREANRKAVGLEADAVKGATFRKNEAAKRKTDTVKANNTVKVEAAKQATKSTPAAKAAPASKPAKPRAPRQNKSVGAPKPPRPTK
jgi:hypothetical protein